jgi:pimeloyl-ACP methyl ester carboxylesterase
MPRLRRIFFLTFALAVIAHLAWMWTRPTTPAPLTPGRFRAAFPAYNALAQPTAGTTDIAWSHWAASKQKRARQEASSLPSSSSSSSTSSTSRPNGLPIILLHGSPGSGEDFNRLAPLLAAQGFDVFAPDLPGFGQSEPRPPSMNMHAHAANVLAWMDHLHIDKAHVVGWSNSGGVVLTLADTAPGRLASATMLATIGCQENEGSGSYWMEHAKYAAGFASVGGLLELVPHFGLLGPFHERTNFLRQFWENDQRPLSTVMSRLQVPMLVLQGKDDFLVPCRAGLDHARRIPNATLVVLNASHFIPFMQPQEGADVLAWWASKNEPALVTPISGTAQLRDSSGLSPPFDHSANLRAAWERGRSAPHAQPFPEPSARLEDRAARLFQQIPWWVQLLLLAWLVARRPTLGVLVAVLLIPALSIEWFVTFVAIIAGMSVHSLLPAFTARRTRRSHTRSDVPVISPTDWRIRLTHPVSQAWRYQFTTRARRWSAQAAGLHATNAQLAAFIVARAFAIIAWSVVALVPAWITAVALLRPLHRWALRHLPESPLVALLISAFAIPLVLLAIKLPPMLLSRPGRWRLRQAFSRAIHREYWPTWLCYVPLAPWWFILGYRFRSLHAFGACNAGIDAGGGFIGESKARIMHNLGTSPHLLTTALIEANTDATVRLTTLRRLMQQQPTLAKYPLILKPNSGYRGFAVKLVRSDDEARRYFESMHSAAVVQLYHPGPNEVGILWIRQHLPGQAPTGEPDGFIFSITAKRFPVITGDGLRTLEELLWQHQRFSRQAHVFLERFVDQSSRVLAKGEELPLTVSGNHCQGTLFYDGAHLITPQLTRAIDDLARNYDHANPTQGLDAVRFDLRYTTDDALMRAEPGCMGIVEMNGTSSESTNIYDPDKSMLWAYRTMYAHWYHMYRIGKARQVQGVTTPTWREFFRNSREYFDARTGSSLAD